MVKYIAVKRQTKDITLDQVLKVKIDKEPKYYQHIDDVDRRHRFKTSKKIRQEIDINLANKINSIRIEEKQDAEGSYFGDMISLKRSTFGSINEKMYMYEAYTMSQSLPIVLHNLGKLIQTSVRFLRTADKCCQSIILDTLPYLIKDTREEFYPYFINDILVVLNEIMNIEEVELYEKIFMLIAYGIKYLEKQIILGYKVFFDRLFQCFFYAKHKITRQLAGEALSYLIRKHFKRGIIKITFERIAEFNQNLSALDQNRVLETLTTAIFQSVIGMQNYIVYNGIQILQEIWNQNLTQGTPPHPTQIIIFLDVFKGLFKNISKLIVQGVTEIGSNLHSGLEQKRKDILLNLVDFYQFINEQKDLDNPEYGRIAIESCLCIIEYYQIKKLNQTLLNKVLQICSKVSSSLNELYTFIGKLIVASLRKPELQLNFINSSFVIGLFMNDIQIDQHKLLISSITHIDSNGFEEQIVFSKEIYQLLVAASVRLLQQPNDIDCWLQIAVLNGDNHKLQLKETHQIFESINFYSLLSFDSTRSLQYISLCTIIKSLEIASFLEERIQMILLTNLEIINKLIQLFWTDVKSDFTDRIESQTQRFQQYLKQQMGDEHMILDSTQKSDFIFMQSECLVVESSYQKLYELIATKIYTLRALLSLKKQQQIFQFLKIEFEFMDTIQSDEWNQFLHSSQIELPLQYNSIILQLLIWSERDDITLLPKEKQLTYHRQVLLSKSRIMRLTSIQILQNLNGGQDKDLFNLMEQMDANEIDLDNERHIKMIMLNLRVYLKDNHSLITRFMHGFAFNKFQLTRGGIIDLISQSYKQINSNDNNMQSLFYFLQNLYFMQQNNQIEKIEGNQFFFQNPLDYNALDFNVVIEEVLLPSLTISSKFFNETLSYKCSIIILNIIQEKTQSNESVIVLSTMEQANNIYEKYSKPIQNTLMNNRLINTFLKILTNVYANLPNNNQSINHPLKSLCLDQLLKDHEGIQSQSLQCLKVLELNQAKTEHKIYIQEFFNSLTRLTDGKIFRHELTQINLDMPEELRKEFVNYLTRTLYPKIYSTQKIQKKQKGRYTSVEIRRNAVFDFLGQLEEEDDQNILFDLIKEKHNLNTSTLLTLNDQLINQNSQQILKSVPLQVILRFLNTLHNLIERLGFKIPTHRLEDFLSIVLSMSQASWDVKREGGHLASKVKDIQKQCSKLLNRCIQKYSSQTNFELEIEVKTESNGASAVMLQCLETAIQLDSFKQAFLNLVKDSQYQASSALKLLITLSSIQETHSSLVRYEQEFLSQFFCIYREVKREQYQVVGKEDSVMGEEEQENFDKESMQQQIEEEEIQEVEVEEEEEEDETDEEQKDLEEQEEQDNPLQQKQDQKLMLHKRYQKSHNQVIKQLNLIFINLLNLGDLYEVRINDKSIIDLPTPLQSLFINKYGVSSLEEIMSYFKTQSKFSSIQYLIEKNRFSLVYDVETLYVFYGLIAQMRANKVQVQFCQLEQWLEFFISCISSKNFYVIPTDQELGPKQQNKKLISEMTTYIIKMILEEMNSFQVFNETSRSMIQWIFSTYSLLLTQISIPLRLRQAIVDIIFLLNCIYPQFGLQHAFLEQLKMMNTKNNSVINDELDYDQCLQGCQQFYQSLQADALDDSRLNTIHIVMQNMFYLITSPELSVRVLVLEIFKKYLDMMVETQSPLMIEYVKSKMIPQVVKNLQKSHQDEQLMKLCTKILDLYLRCTQEILKNSNQSISQQIYIQKVFFTQDVVDYMSNQRGIPGQDTNYAELYYIFYNQYGDEEQEVLSNLFDIQIIKRVRAINILVKHLDSHTLMIQQKTIINILMPLLEYIILTKCCQRQRLTDSNRSHLSTLQCSALQAYGSLIHSLPWNDWVGFMQGYAKQLVASFGYVEGIQKNDYKTQALIKLLTFIAQNKNKEYDVIELIKKHKGQRESLKQGLSDQIRMFQKNSVMEEEEDEEVRRLRVETIDLQDIAEYKQISFQNLVKEEKNAQIYNLEMKDRRAIKKDTLWEEICKLEEFSTEQWASKSKILLEKVYSPLKNIFLLTSNHQLAKTKEAQDKQQAEDRVRIQLAQILVELVVQFPPDTLMVELNRLVGKISRSMKSRDQVIRDQGRQQVILILEKVGPQFFQYILRSLRHVLTQGFENHVLNYTLNQMLQRSTEQGGVDYCIEDVLELLMDEVYGSLQQEKELENMPKKAKEVKSHTAFNSIQLVSQQLDLLTTLPKLIATIDKYDNIITKQTLTHSTQNRLAEVFSHIYIGLLKNPSMPLQNPSSLIEFIYTLLADFAQPIASQLNKEHGCDFTLLQESEKISRFNREKLLTIQLPSHGSNSIVHYMAANRLKTNSSLVFNQTMLLAMKILQYALNRYPKEMMEALNQNLMLEKLFTQVTKVVVDCLGTNEQQLVSNAMSLMSTLVAQPMKWLKQHKKSLVNNLLVHIAKLASSDIEMIRGTLQLLRSILESPIKELAEFTPSQQKSLLEFIQVFIDNNKDNQIVEAFECLRTIVHREWALPQIYDLVEKVKETMIQSNIRKIQLLCKATLIQFLIKYPLSSGALQANIIYLLASLDYRYPEGRIIVYECINQIVLNFPPQTTILINQDIFLSLLASRVKLQDIESQEAIQNTITTVVNSFTHEQAQNILSLTLTWLSLKEDKVIQSGLISLRFLYSRDQSNETIFSRIAQVVDNILENWNNWKINMSEQNMRQKNLKTSLWQETLEQSSVPLLPELTNQCLYLANLLQQIFQKQPKHLLKILENQKSLCSLVKFTSYPCQNTANQFIMLFTSLLNNKDMDNFINSKVIESQEFFLENNERIMKFYFVNKFQRNSMIEKPQLTNTMIIVLLKVLEKVQQSDVINNIIQNFRKIISILMSKSNRFKLALENLANLFIEIVNDHSAILTITPLMSDLCIEYFIKVRRIEQIPDYQQLFEIIDNGMKDVEQWVGPKNFVEQYARIQADVVKQHAIRKVEMKQQAITQPEKFAKVKTDRSKKNKVRRGEKLLKLKGMAPRKVIKL